MAIFFLIAGVSFLQTWQADQSLFNNLSFGVFQLDNPGMAKNALGIMGVWIGFTFFYKGFGLASFAFCFVFFLIGVYLIAKIQPISILKTLKYSFFSVIWVSLFLGLVFNQSYQVLGGVFGHFGILYLKGLMGSVGTILFLIVYVLVFAIAVFNIELYHPSVKLKAEHIFEKQFDNKVTNQATNNIVQNEPFEGAITFGNGIETEPEEATLNQEDFVLYEKEVEPAPEPIISSENEGSAIETTEAEISASIDIPLETPNEPIPVSPALDLTEKVDDKIPVKIDSGLVLQVNDIPEEEETPVTDLNKKHFGIDEAYDPTLEFSGYKFPTIDLLTDYGDSKSIIDTNELSEKTRMIEDTLKNYNIGIKKISATVGPTVTLYEIIPQDGVRIAKIKNLEDDIALSLAALGIRIIAPIPGKGTIGIEVPNSNPAMVPMRSLIASNKFINSDMDLPIAFGKTISNEVFIADLAKMPHLLMAGATGQGKSVGLNAILVSLLYKKHPSQIKFVLVDPKKVELNIYKTIERHFLAKIPGDADAIITDTKLVVNTLNSLCKEMDERYDLLKDAQVRNLKEYNAKFLSRRLVPTDKLAHRFLPYIVVVIDELADLMMTAGKEVELPIARLAQLARAIGIHLILATQRPSVNIITGTIKANFPARLAFRVSQKIDSRTILDANGADQLIGKGDMLFSNGNDLVRVQCAFVDTPEVERIATFIGSQNGNEPYLLPLYTVEGEDGGGGEMFDSKDKDELFNEAAHLIVSSQQGSTSLLQRKLNLGYNRAGRLIDQLEKAGIVGPFKGSKAREVLISDIVELEEKLKNF
jgi:S-DNA-T family DNA segregation ATPase FtsK/SpoIIIE